ncbi:MAG: glycine cleavage system aminomethyltransferase GcvT [Lachnospiraceae bacterium]|nr:glycine cleavage system aminomethyltransferase GcvT [Lachnospiraceae bacterium]
MEKKTVLYEKHLEANGKMVPFGGYILPVQYETGVIKEHMTVRTGVGMFDVSHMGEIVCKGKDALKNINHLMTNSYDDMYDGQARYTVMCNEFGGVVDDFIVYRVNEEEFFLVPNAANVDKDYAWILDHQIGDVTFENVSDKYGQIALQGPKAKDVMLKLVDPEEIPKKYYSANFNATVAGMKCILSRTGYTGELGYEIYIDKDNAPKMWDILLEKGKEEGVIPCGLGARDTLRLEAGMCLYGHEMTENVSPLETALDIFVKMDKEEFIGKQAMIDTPSNKTRVGLKITGRGIAREDMKVYKGDKLVGETTSGSHLPYMKGAYAMAIVNKDYAELGTEVEVDIRGKRVAAEVIELPFYKRPRKKA